MTDSINRSMISFKIHKRRKDCLVKKSEQSVPYILKRVMIDMRCRIVKTKNNQHNAIWSKFYVDAKADLDLQAKIKSYTKRKRKIKRH